MNELELLDKLAKLERDREAHVLGTVVAVRGSASAKPGSKILISAAGENLWGWVGGGCAESFTINQALEALEEARPRTITADLDDAVFGLGMPCGGVMEIFLEPRLPPERLSFEFGSEKLRRLAESHGFLAEIPASRDESVADAIRALAEGIRKTRGLERRALCEGAFRPRSSRPSELLILGHSRITEALATLGALLEWPTRVYGLNLEAKHYPGAVRAQAAQPDYAGLEVKAGSYVVIASHHKGDHEYLRAALEAGAEYVGMVASRKRAGLVLEHLRAQGFPEAALGGVRAPAGLDLRCRNPGEIALSIFAELLA